MKLIPAPRGTGLVAAPASKRILQLAGVEDCYTASRGATSTMGNFIKATFQAIAMTYQVLTPELWPKLELPEEPYSEFSSHLTLTAKKFAA